MCNDGEPIAFGNAHPLLVFCLLLVMRMHKANARFDEQPGSVVNLKGTLNLEGTVAPLSTD